MNIFKILASGDGSLKEPNISAFLAFLLNPKADHGLGSSFLQKVLKPFIEESNQRSNDENILQPLWSDIENNENRTETDEKYILDLSVNSRFNVDVVLEKALKTQLNKEDDTNCNNRNKTKEIVDIIIKITEQPDHTKENISFLFENNLPVSLILVENKINPCKNAGEQLRRQFNNSIKDLPNYMLPEEWEKWKNNICTILISTGEKKMCDQFVEFKNHINGNKNSIHLSWDSNLTSYSIKGIILELLQECDKGIIAPIHTYTTETLKSLINFIENDFSSNADDQQRGGQNSKPEYYDSLDELWKSGKCKIDQSEFDRVKRISKMVLMNENITFKEKKHNKTHIITFIKTNADRLCSIRGNSNQADILLLGSIVNEKVKEELTRLNIDDWGGKEVKSDLKIKLNSFQNDEDVVNFIKFLSNNA